tara:strand:+ start:77 stop:319 length:243 start_codon:yes stop_codon:yes gene_type:complete
MSMIGVKSRLDENWENKKRDFSNWHKKVHGYEKEYNPKCGYDQIGIKPHKPMKSDEAVLYAIYTQLLLLIDIKPNLKNEN